MGIGDKFRKVFNIDSDYYDDYEEDEEGNEIEYTDELTLGRSILNRTPYSAAM